MQEFLSIKENKVTAEITEKRSRFIANMYYVSTKDEAEHIIKDVKSKYYDAKHNCIAYRVMEQDTLLERSSDDGEPSGTAGTPMLAILKNHNLCNVVVVVTRYFGGILLGTGGLVRAYSEATLKAINNSNIVKKCYGYEMEITLNYNNLGHFKYYCKNNNISVTNIEYLDNIICKIELEEKQKDKLIENKASKKIKIEEAKILCKKLINKSVEK